MGLYVLLVHNNFLHESNRLKSEINFGIFYSWDGLVNRILNGNRAVISVFEIPEIC